MSEQAEIDLRDALGRASTLAAEVERLQAAKRRALAIADERAKENAELRDLLSEARSGYIAGSPPDEAWDARRTELLAQSKDEQKGNT